MPPLRPAASEDIPLPGRALPEEIRSPGRGKAIRGIEKKALHALAMYDLPGNVRELENILERAVILCRRERIGEDDLPVLAPGKPRHAGNVAKLPLPEKLREYERDLIREALERNRFVGTHAARDLGISESTLRYKMESLGIKPG